MFLLQVTGVLSLIKEISLSSKIDKTEKEYVPICFPGLVPRPHSPSLVPRPPSLASFLSLLLGTPSRASFPSLVLGVVLGLALVLISNKKLSL